mgnify:CR=1 FL=1
MFLKNIKYTKLPTDIVYLNHRFVGCLLEKVNGIQLHKLSGLPNCLKRKIMNLN